MHDELACYHALHLLDTSTPDHALTQVVQETHETSLAFANHVKFLTLICQFNFQVSTSDLLLGEVYVRLGVSLVVGFDSPQVLKDGGVAGIYQSRLSTHSLLLI